jgi:hypothetical protein
MPLPKPSSTLTPKVDRGQGTCGLACAGRRSFLRRNESLKATRVGEGVAPRDLANPWAVYDNFIDRVVIQCSEIGNI